MKIKHKNSIVVLSLLTLLNACSNTPPSRLIASRAEGGEVSTIASLPEIVNDNGEMLLAIKKQLKKNNKTMAPADFEAASNKLLHYFRFLGLTAKDFVAAEKVVTADDAAPTATVKTSEVDSSDGEDEKTPSNLNAIKRLFASSTQFLDCQNLIDWNCLEKKPVIVQSADFRKEVDSSLGMEIPAGDKPNIEVYFTKAFDGKTPPSGVADRLAEKLENDSYKNVSLAMYGIDDIKESMERVYSNLIKLASDPKVNFRSVVDVSGYEKTKTPWVLTYKEPADKYQSLVEKNWVFAPASNPDNITHALFMYNGTPDFIHDINKDVKVESDSRVRIEFPSANIMHNKFAVLENVNGEKSVWTGTANFSNHCMGTEVNANMSLYIKNNKIADAYQAEFDHMYNFNDSLKVVSKLVTSPDGKSPLTVGRFHHNKVPVAHRLYSFNDGTKMRVHFAPTDDAEHRVILPMLLSAKAGDEIRISMFGGTGYEIIRAMQYAVSRGANVKIAFDRRLGHGLTSWIRDSILNVKMKNPYLQKDISPGTITVRTSTWTGKNHYKAGSLTRRQADGSMRAEEMIVGSQNWSSGGNDSNDENLISIQNLKTDVEVAKLFNNEFDTNIWPKSREE